MLSLTNRVFGLRADTSPTSPAFLVDLGLEAPEEAWLATWDGTEWQRTPLEALWDGSGTLASPGPYLAPDLDSATQAVITVEQGGVGFVHEVQVVP